MYPTHIQSFNYLFNCLPVGLPIDSSRKDISHLTNIIIIISVIIIIIIVIIIIVVVIIIIVVVIIIIVIIMVPRPILDPWNEY